MIGRTIYVICPDENDPSGGHKKLYRHVDVLNRSGRPAVALHGEPGFRYTWFANQTLVSDVKMATVSRDDYVVIPEIHGPVVADMWPGVRKVMLNQNAYFTFAGYSLDPGALSTPYLHPDVVATIVVSDDNLSYLRYVFPRHQIHRMRYSIDPDVFSYSATKKRWLCLMSRRNLPDAVQVINILKFRDRLAGYEVIALHDLSEAEIAEALRQSRIFLSFSSPEGFGLPPAEAMACGCVTIGYHGRCGREFFRPEFSYPIELGDIEGYARTVERVICELDADAAPFERMTRAAAAYIGEHYSPRTETETILRCWDAIMAT
jgi:Glycosyl transferases group 1